MERCLDNEGLGSDIYRCGFCRRWRRLPASLRGMAIFQTRYGTFVIREKGNQEEEKEDTGGGIWEILVWGRGFWQRQR